VFNQQYSETTKHKIKLCNRKQKKHQHAYGNMTRNLRKDHVMCIVHVQRAIQ